MNIWKSIKKFFTKVSQDEKVKATVDAALEVTKEVTVDYVKDKAQKEIQRYKE